MNELSFGTWLKLFRAQKRIDEIDEQRNSHEPKQHDFKHHLLSFMPSRSQPVV
jgi:hypothetical protein